MPCVGAYIPAHARTTGNQRNSGSNRIPRHALGMAPMLFQAMQLRIEHINIRNCKIIFIKQKYKIYNHYCVLWHLLITNMYSYLRGTIPIYNKYSFNMILYIYSGACYTIAHKLPIWHIWHPPGTLKKKCWKKNLLILVQFFSVSTTKLLICTLTNYEYTNS